MNIYLFSFIIGGIFVSLSALSGIDGADFDQDFDFDSDHYFDIPLDSDIEITPYEEENKEEDRIIPRQRKFPRLPITSFKFWTFGSCFFGLTGLVLSWLNTGISTNFILVVSIFVGLTCGISMVSVLRNLRKNQANSLLKSEEIAGLLGVVEVPFNPQSKGKIRVNIKDLIVDFMAITEEDKEFQKGDKVLVVGRENNKVWVVSANVLEDE